MKNIFLYIYILKQVKMNIIDLENENHKLTDLNEHYKS